MTTTVSTPVHAPSSLGKDVLASVVVFLVALPLCMGVAIASGLPPTAGIITGIVGGIVVGYFTGSPLQVSGPAAGLTVLVLDLVKLHGPEMLGIIVLFAGLFQFAAGQLKLGQWFRAVSPAVIHGMLAGIGVLIFVSQFHVMLDGTPPGSGMQNLLAIPRAFADAVRLGDSHLTAGEVGLLTIATMVAWSKLAPAGLRLIPAPLVGVVVAMLAAAIFKLGSIHYVEVPSNIWSVTILPTPERLLRIIEPAILVGAISIGLIASAETLLCATAVDQMHTGARTRYNVELKAQGIGNAICGVLGVLPMTGVIVRSGANVEAGGKTRLSTILHGFWLLLFASVLPFTLHYVPVAALAAVLVYTGFKLAYPKIVPALRQYGRSEVFIYAATVLAIVGTDLLKGVLVGIALSLAKLIWVFSHLEIRKEPAADGKRIDLYLAGSATVVRLPTLATALEELPAGAEIHVHVDNLDYIDHACIDLLNNWNRQHGASGGSLTIEWDELAAKYRSRSLAGPREAMPS
jgi:MFS superfamily sulfate permease-like transporter